MLIEFVIQNLETKKYYISFSSSNKWDLNVNSAKMFSSEQEAYDEMHDEGTGEVREDFEIGHFEVKKICSYATP